MKTTREIITLHSSSPVSVGSQVISAKPLPDGRIRHRVSSLNVDDLSSFRQEVATEHAQEQMAMMFLTLSIPDESPRDLEMGFSQTLDLIAACKPRPERQKEEGFPFYVQRVADEKKQLAQSQAQYDALRIELDGTMTVGGVQNWGGLISAEFCNLFPVEDIVFADLGELVFAVPGASENARQAIIIRNEIQGVMPSPDLESAIAKYLSEWRVHVPIAKPTRHAPRAPGLLPQPTFYEARTGATAISDGRDLRDWQAMEGMIAMLHAPKNSIMQTRFEPCALLLSWWGSPSGAQLQTLQSELQNLEFDALVTYFVCLSWTIEEYQVTTSLDSIIEAIGRGTDARRSTKSRAMWRSKVWRWMLLFDSLAVIGARRGTWKEPPDGDKKREKVDADKLYSRDALIKIIGTRDTEQGTFDNSAPPKEVSFVAGAWVNQWRGNREILSEFGNVRAIASIPRGKPSGAWAACIGFALQQKWREQAHKTPITRTTKGEKKIVTQKFKPFTRRTLLAQLWRSDIDPEEILKSVNPERAKEYWGAAVTLLQKHGVIGFYKEIKPLAVTGYGWQEVWLDQPLDIRPTGANWKDAITISKSATAARKRGRKKSAP